jgi:hypothetical protein
MTRSQVVINSEHLGLRGQNILANFCPGQHQFIDGRMFLEYLLASVNLALSCSRPMKPETR